MTLSLSTSARHPCASSSLDVISCSERRKSHPPASLPSLREMMLPLLALRGKHHYFLVSSPPPWKEKGLCHRRKCVSLHRRMRKGASLRSLLSLVEEYDLYRSSPSTARRREHRHHDCQGRRNSCPPVVVLGRATPPLLALRVRRHRFLVSSASAEGEGSLRRCSIAEERRDTLANTFVGSTSERSPLLHAGRIAGTTSDCSPLIPLSGSD